MCGIAGFWSLKEDLEAEQTLFRMGVAIRSRGPDNCETWYQASDGIGLVHRRLSIIDLSENGNQPMVSHSGRYVISYNGEIYNFGALRDKLDVEWRGHSDTEVILALVEKLGVATALPRLVGMFAFALWDKKTKTLTLARDRLGEKPLYYGFQRGKLFFGSELSAIRAHRDFTTDIDQDSLSLYLRYSYVPAPYSICKNVRKLLPGTFWQLRAKDFQKNDTGGSVTEYWSAQKCAQSGQDNLFQGTEREAIQQLTTLIAHSVENQMIADVPIGSFLSGGVDSSTITAFMQNISASPISTFTIGFDDEEFDEATYARDISQHLGTSHTELIVDGKRARDVIPKLPEIYDEPFADASQIPTYLVSKLARKDVTVSLSGDAGDELFGGYNRHQAVQSFWGKISGLPRPIRAALAGVITTVPPGQWSAVFNGLNYLLPKQMHHSDIGSKIYKLANMIPAESPEAIYRAVISKWHNPEQIAVNAVEPVTHITNSGDHLENADLVHKMMYLDMVSYLPDNILTKVDRAAMSVSLETRIPFLDHRIVEFAWSLPTSMKIKGRESKWILRQLLYNHVPRKLIERPKMGFSVPLSSWLKGPLKDWASELLDEKSLIADGHLSSKPIQKKWQEHLSGRRDNSHELWSVLMFQAWKNNAG